MTIWLLLQASLDLVFVIVLVLFWAKSEKRSKKDDPRLSRGLQILQSKIAILEDLSDKTEVQVGHLAALMDQKTKDLQNKILEGDRQIYQIEQAMAKSIEVAKIFQDKIPHEEIIERQKMIKYVKAAALAHSGLSAEEISKSVDLPREEIEFIIKVNRHELRFAPTDLPEWAKEGIPQDLRQINMTNKPNVSS